MNEIVTFASTEMGPNILFLGSVHGNEKCGTVAIDEAITFFREKKWTLKKGSVTFIARANPDAYEADVRQIAYNLNRIFDDKNIDSKEHRVAEILKKYIAAADFTIDLHSVYSGDTPFVFLDSPDDTMRELCHHLSLPFIMTGWNEIYADKTEMDTISYAIVQGRAGMTIECGSHKTPESILVAKKSLRETLQFFEMIDGEKILQKNQQFVNIEKIFYRPKDARFAKNWKNFDPVEAGEIIGFSGEIPFVCEEDGCIILPKNYGKEGDEWFYFGNKKF